MICFSFIYHCLVGYLQVDSAGYQSTCHLPNLNWFCRAYQDDLRRWSIPWPSQQFSTIYKRLEHLQQLVYHPLYRLGECRLADLFGLYQYLHLLDLRPRANQNLHLVTHAELKVRVKIYKFLFIFTNLRCLTKSKKL